MSTPAPDTRPRTRGETTLRAQIATWPVDNDGPLREFFATALTSEWPKNFSFEQARRVVVTAAPCVTAAGVSDILANWGPTAGGGRSDAAVLLAEHPGLTPDGIAALVAHCRGAFMPGASTRTSVISPDVQALVHLVAHGRTVLSPMETTLSYHRAMAPRRRSARDEPASGDPTLFGAEHANALLVAYCPAATPDQLLGLLGQWGRDASVVTGLVRHRAATAEFLRLALDWCPSDAVTRGVAASRVTQRDDALFAYVLSRAENDPRAVAELIVRAGEARWLMVAPSFERLPTLARTVIAHPAFLARRHLTAAMLQPLLESREEDVRMAALVAMARAAPSSLPGAHASASPDIAPAAAPRRALTR